jgi:cyclophilin family peptidyl-prolyl cis-trans isomerase
VMELDPSLAPQTVNNFVMLANLGYYDKMPIAHVQEGTYVVFGSPAGSPASDVGYQLPLEVPTPTGIVTGSVSMYPVSAPGGGFAASGSQFFVSFSSIPESATPLNLFGKVTEGMDVAQKLAIGDIVKQVTVTAK